jgi:Mor family transcriptional regulator
MGQQHRIAPKDIRDPNINYKEIPRYPYYEAGTDGSIWSWKRPGGHIGDYPKRLATPTRSKRAKKVEYLQVCLGAGNTEAVHRLILETFVGPCPENMECCHEDGNAKNNTLTNLKWGTKKQNGEDRCRHGTVTSKLNQEDIIDIFELWNTGKSATYISKIYKVATSTIWNIINKKTYTLYSVDLIKTKRKFKLTEDNIKEIRRLHKQGHTVINISKLFKVLPLTIYNIIKYKQHIHIGE